MVEGVQRDCTAITEFKPGDRVWLYNPLKMMGRCPTIQLAWEGPHTVVKNVDPLTMRIVTDSGKYMTVRSTRLKPFCKLANIHQMIPSVEEKCRPRLDKKYLNPKRK